MVKRGRRIEIEKEKWERDGKRVNKSTRKRVWERETERHETERNGDWDKLRDKQTERGWEWNRLNN